MTWRILYADDEPDLREIVEIALGMDAEFEVRTCGSGMEALAVFPDFEPHLVLLDVMMPEMDGPTTLAALRALPGGATAAIVFITARASASDRDTFLALGADGVIEKPFDPMALPRTVRNHFRHV